jgi:hypothetical protein
MMGAVGMLARTEIHCRRGSIGVLAVLVGFVGMVVLAVRRWRCDLAILKPLGFDRGQVRAVVAWPATTTTLPVLALPVHSAAAALLANVVAAAPGRLAARTQPALALRRT